MSVNEDDSFRVNVSISDALIIGTEVNERVEMEREESVRVPSDTAINDVSSEVILEEPSIFKEESEIVPLPLMN